MEFPENTAHDAPDVHADTPPAVRHEPILTLPPALTAYVLLL
ncbi:MAG: rhomboid family intramembrane serine protease, partial [Bradyrhizobium sp.]|nr:rhomboid family intramembrane serine protease [Bradyrhizobium sp.]